MNLLWSIALLFTLAVMCVASGNMRNIPYGQSFAKLAVIIVFNIAKNTHMDNNRTYRSASQTKIYGQYNQNQLHNFHLSVDNAPDNEQDCQEDEDNTSLVIAGAGDNNDQTGRRMLFIMFYSIHRKCMPPS